MTTPLAGRCDPSFAEVEAEAAFARNFDDLGEVGAAVCVFVDGDPVVDLWGGFTDPNRRHPWAADTLVDVYSVGKPVIATLVLQLVDDGTLTLDDPIATHWPAFGAAGKEAVTVRHALCHRAGVPAIRERLDHQDLYDFDRMTAALAATRPWWTPDERHSYHTNTYGHLLGGMLLAATGELPGTLLQQRIAQPLGADIHFGVTYDDLARCADVIWDGPILPFDYEDAAGLGGDRAMTLWAAPRFPDSGRR